MFGIMKDRTSVLLDCDKQGHNKEKSRKSATREK